MAVWTMEEGRENLSTKEFPKVNAADFTVRIQSDFYVDMKLQSREGS